MRKMLACIGILAALTLSACANKSLIPPANRPGDSIESGDEIPDDPTVPPDTNVPETPETPDVPETPDQPDTPVEPEKPAADMMVCSKTDHLTVRSGKGSSYAALGYLDKNDMAGYVALSGGWYQITYMRQTAYVSASYATLETFDKAGDSVEKVVTEGKKLLGIPYVFGAQRYHWGNGALNAAFNGKSFDCSSLTQYIYKAGANVNLATTSREQSRQGRAVAKSELKRGDLMFFTNAARYYNTGIDRIGHVAMYLGDNYILHTASDHAVVEPISATRWSYYITARRFV